MLDPMVLHQNILADVAEKTGLHFRWIDGMDTSDRTIAEAVLPVLKEWVPGVAAAPNIRGGIFGRFITPHAYPYMSWVMQQWEAEQNTLCEGSLIGALTLLVKPTDAVPLWGLCRRLIGEGRLTGYYFLLLSKLAKFPTIAAEVKDTVVEVIEGKGPEGVVLLELAKIDDPRIVKWFERQTSADPYLRTIRKRIVERGKKLPAGVGYAPAGPDRREEIFSTEIDLDQVSAVLGDLAKQIGITIPAALRKASFLSSVETDRWLQAPISSKDGRTLNLWYRLEDVDVVEIAVTQANEKRARPS